MGRLVAPPLALLLVACAAAPGTTSGTAPDVLLIVADDLGHADVGFHGCADIATPNLDRLAARGVVCTDAHVSASVCAPSRAGLLTARYPQRHGFECNLAGRGGLAPDQRTFIADLADAGYETALVGKWHLGSSPEQSPLEVGFGEFRGLLGGSRSYLPLEQPSRRQALWRESTAAGAAELVRVEEADLEYLTDWFTDQAVDLLSAERDAPLFLALTYTAPHTPMHARPDLLDRCAHIENERRRTYAAMVMALDEGVGRLLDALEARGSLDDTLVVFLSDNGGATNNASDNGPWRGMKGSKWEGGQRVPFVLHRPRALRPGVYDGLVSSLDVGATVLAEAGVAPTLPLDGVDLTPFLSGARGDEPHEALFWRRDVVAAVREGDWKLVRVTEEDGSLRAPVLIDLASDPDEDTDVAAQHPEEVARLGARLEAWERELAPPSWTEGDRWRRNQRHKHRMDVLGREAERRFP